MLLVLDTNEFVFGLGRANVPHCEELLSILASSVPRHTLRIPRRIVNEVRDNLEASDFKSFLRIASLFTTIDEDSVVPLELVARYESSGLKPADAFIAAYTSWVGSELLVSENRHFLGRHGSLPFKVISADKAVKLLSK